MIPRTARDVFSETSSLELYLRIEVALAHAQAELEMIPSKAAAAIEREATLAALDVARLRHDTARTGYPIAPLVRQLTAMCGEHGRWVHWGATTQDVLNTALAMQVNESWSAIEAQVTLIATRLVVLAEEHRATLMVARTFGGHALPTTFGFKVAVWLSAVLRHARRLQLLQNNPMEGELAGAAGTLASFAGKGLAVRRRLMQALELPEQTITSAAMRDTLNERVMVLANLCATLAKITQDIAELAATEIGELSEPASGGRDSSSTLPFKANPVYCAQATTAATLVATYANVVLQGARQHQERSAEGMLDFQGAPLAFVHADDCVRRTLHVLQGLQVFPDRMRANLNLTRGIVLAEGYMMALAPHIGRLAAHDRLHDACRATAESGTELHDALATMSDVTRHLDGATLEALADPTAYLGDAQTMIDAVLAAARSHLPEVQ